jgi:hypothetical protein
MTSRTSSSWNRMAGSRCASGEPQAVQARDEAGPRDRAFAPEGRTVGHGKEHRKTGRNQTPLWDAQQPTNAVDGRWAFSSSWTTVQIGGDVVYHGGGIVQSPTGEVVGTSTPCVECGVLDVAKSAPGPKCAGAVADNTHPQAMWMFSADAYGVYGFSDLRFQNGSRYPAMRRFFAAHQRVKLAGGTGLLRTVTGTQTGAER